VAIRVAVVGAGGRMGSEVVRLVEAQTDMKVAAAVEAAAVVQSGAVVAGRRLTAELEPALTECDVAVDFSVAEAVERNAVIAVRAGRPLVCGVTGLSETAMSGLRRAAQSIPVVYAANFSVGVAALVRLAETAARLLGRGFDAEVVEVHHRGKKDAPSGTARLLAEIVMQARDGGTVRQGRDGVVGPKPEGEVGISAVRTGDVVGEHLVIFGGTGERIELSHRAQSRAAFAAGVVKAIRFAHGRSPGWFGMADVLAAEGGPGR